MVVGEQAALLRTYIAAGADVTAGDYDKRTPLHIAAAEGKLAMVSGTGAASALGFARVCQTAKHVAVICSSCGMKLQLLPFRHANSSGSIQPCKTYVGLLHTAS
eukprot:GHRQ01031754.1.p2 GENE.GHRQ01031754.1~~GHRQ01031754.1.p2  ORF type:complete len:104 (-),score=23.36 GHRQ01031754.1:176-487(-)